VKIPPTFSAVAIAVGVTAIALTVHVKADTTLPTGEMILAWIDSTQAPRGCSHQDGDGERYFMNYRQRLRSAEDIGAPAATGISAEDLRALRMLYDR